jgi:hypothetical protein
LGSEIRKRLQELRSDLGEGKRSWSFSHLYLDTMKILMKFPMGMKMEYFVVID